MHKLITILGPTASGKTNLAIKLAHKFNGAIISADSRQIYQEMNIGTGKDLSDYKLIPYYLIDIIPPNQQLTLAGYQQLAIKYINQTLKKNKQPFLVGGTGLYLSSILENYQIPNIIPNKKIRYQLAKQSLNTKIERLKKLDPQSLDLIDFKNPRRVDRALEICLQGYQFSATHKKNKPLYNNLIIDLQIKPEQLIKKINQRVDLMLKQGLVEETQKIIKKYGQKSQPLLTIGYAEIVDYLNKKTTIEEAVKLIKLHTRQYAKRQMTWFKRMKNVKWIDNQTQATELIQKFL
jgi:tRNA dimethylallyltransferase